MFKVFPFTDHAHQILHEDFVKLRSQPIFVDDLPQIKKKKGAKRVLEELRQGKNLARVGRYTIYEAKKCDDCLRHREADIMVLLLS